MKNILLLLFLPVSYFVFLPLSFAHAQDEYPVAYWGQKHVQEALLLHRNLSPGDFLVSCRKAKLYRSSSHPLSGNLKAAWNDFSRRKTRLRYCQSQPGRTWYLLGEAPYFMLPENPGSHK
ncbi:hypothetical protein ACSYAY_08990 [Leptospirillum ferriphilum]|jgi:hypothetical protein|uniref:Uncharacterized protein n=3 Tax=Leptospirillum TaxID=179 RepID=A0A094WA14_9BACT|nr:hypothetical protein [Leptospirillum ferriphilum]AFS54125.1 hypothetical protein LFML04_1925 [Leptospirillum ferriphilum ML-04]EDZ38044.1 MAG: Protein of unknown function [Leptospirillum sp. Group II '5-way CG']KGA93365.1 hypothetical protein LptCag_0401 [Leptospirillum ferriphilum]